jgi:outer membrane protein assembly factor BamB
MPTTRCRNENPAAGAARRPVLLAAAVLIAEVLAVGAIGCGGGGGDSGPTGPLLPWPRLRRTDTNTGSAVNDVGANEGAATLLHRFDDETPSRYPPIVGRDSSVYLALEEGLLSLDTSEEEAEAAMRWRIDRCEPAGAALQPVSSLAISPNGRDLVVGSAAGNVFRLREPEDGGAPPECLSSFPVGSRAAPLTSVDGADLELLSFVVGTTTGRLTSITHDGQRRWSFPEGEPFPDDVSSSPAALGTGIVFASPDGGLHTVDQSGRRRWSATIGGAYPAGEIIPSPAVLDEIFTVNAEGDVVAYTPGGSRLWTFSPDGDAKIVGSIAVSPLTTDGGTFIGENVVFALDSNGILYGIGSNTGELVRFCAADNRACLPSTCEEVLDSATGRMEPAPCDEVMRCSETRSQDCGDELPPCPDGESCREQFFCSNDRNRACGQDLCRTDTTGEDGLCRREAKHPLSLDAEEFASSPILSTGSYVVAATADGRVCARRLDGTVPNGTCSDSGERCSLDSCDPPDTCCDVGDDDCTRPGYCKGNRDRACTLDTCPDGQTCGETAWQSGCIALGQEVGTTTLSQPVIDNRGDILVTTERGLAIVR